MPLRGCGFRLISVTLDLQSGWIKTVSELGKSQVGGECLNNTYRVAISQRVSLYYYNSGLNSDSAYHDNVAFQLFLTFRHHIHKSEPQETQEKLSLPS